MTLQPASSWGTSLPGSNYPTDYTAASFYNAFVVHITTENGASIASTLNEPTGLAITHSGNASTSTLALRRFVGPKAAALDAWTYPAGNLGHGGFFRRPSCRPGHTSSRFLAM